jgi:hypothetical protein
MKDQYVGDINDFEKYAILRALQGASQLPLVVCWMLKQLSTGPRGVPHGVGDDASRPARTRPAPQTPRS